MVQKLKILKNKEGTVISGKLREILKSNQVTQVVIWFAFTLSLGVYWFVIKQNVQSTADVQQLRLFFPFVAFAEGIASVMIWIYCRSETRIKQKLSAPLNPSTLAMLRYRPNFLKELESLPQFEQRLCGVISSLAIFFIISLVLNESIAIFGLVASMMSASPEAYLPYAFAALLLNIFMFPRMEGVIEKALALKNELGLS